MARIERFRQAEQHLLLIAQHIAQDAPNCSFELARRNWGQAFVVVATAVCRRGRRPHTRRLTSIHSRQLSDLLRAARVWNYFSAHYPWRTQAWRSSL